MSVGGLTGQEAETLIAAKYEKDYLQDPQVSVFIKEYTSQRITIEGAVAKPGIYPDARPDDAAAGDRDRRRPGAALGPERRHGVPAWKAGEKKISSSTSTRSAPARLEDPLLVNDDVIVVKRVRRASRSGIRCWATSSASSTRSTTCARARERRRCPENDRARALSRRAERLRPRSRSGASTELSTHRSAARRAARRRTTTVHFRDLWHVVVKRKWAVFAVFLIVARHGAGRRR